MSFLCFISDCTRTDFESTDHLPLLNPLPSSLWAKISNWYWQDHSAPPIKIQIALLKPLPGINQYSLSKEDLQGIKLIIKEYTAQDLIFSCSSLYNILLKNLLFIYVCAGSLLLCRLLSGGKWGFLFSCGAWGTRGAGGSLVAERGL